MTAMDSPMNLSTPLMVTDHHYYPLEVEIANYLANEWSVPVLLGIFAAVCASIVIGTVVVVDRAHPNLPKVEKAAIWWFVICEFCSAFAGASAGASASTPNNIFLCWRHTSGWGLI
jgi:hypothetical protein